jgi:hypothetical protein
MKVRNIIVPIGMHKKSSLDAEINEEIMKQHGDATN